MQIASGDLYEAVGVERDREVSRDEVRRGRDRLFAYVQGRVHVAAPGGECPSQPGGLDFLDKADGFFATVRLRFVCPRAVESATIRYDLFFDLDPRHQGIARIAFGDEEGREQVFRDGARTITLGRELTVLDHVRDYLRLGVEHIFTGYDHIAFLFGLLVIAGRDGLRRGARKILVVVTAFTLAHSVTLIASALGFVALSPRLVEPGIALSIVYVGLENLVQPAPRHRWLLTFGFGLVHGFGFASVLKEIGLPHKGLLLSLVSFNVGVEIGQLAVVAAVLPLLSLIARPGVAWAPARSAGLLPKGASTLGEAALVGVVAVATFVLFRRFGVAPVPLAAVTFGGAPALFGLGRRFDYDRVVRLGGSTVIALLATFWFVERALGRSFFGGYLG